MHYCKNTWDNIYDVLNVFMFFREGETVILKCLIQAHPWVYRILWYRDGEEIVASDRTFIDEQQVLCLSVLFFKVKVRKSKILIIDCKRIN